MAKGRAAMNVPVHNSGKEVHSDDIKIEQKAPIGDLEEFEGDVIEATNVINKDYADELVFNEEPVTIRIEPSSEKLAPRHFPVWVNGKGAEVFMNGRWLEMAYLPVGATVTIKRKYLAVIAMAKRDTIQTKVVKHDESEENLIERFTSAATSFSVIEDKNPKGSAWLSELRRRAG